MNKAIIGYAVMIMIVIICAVIAYNLVPEPSVQVFVVVIATLLVAVLIKNAFIEIKRFNDIKNK